MEVKEKVDAYLSHHGVLGMKWGIRKDRKTIMVSPDYKRKKELQKKKISELSTRELQELNLRTLAEKQYSKINDDTTKTGKRIVQRTLLNVGQKTIRSLTRTVGKNILLKLKDGKTIDLKLDSNTLSEIGIDVLLDLIVGGK